MSRGDEEVSGWYGFQRGRGAGGRIMIIADAGGGCRTTTDSFARSFATKEDGYVLHIYPIYSTSPTTSTSRRDKPPEEDPHDKPGRKTDRPRYPPQTQRPRLKKARWKIRGCLGTYVVSTTIDCR